MKPVMDGEQIDFRDVVAAVTDYAIFLLDHDGVVRSWNPGAERIKGWTADEVIGRHFSMFYPPDEITVNKPSRHLQEARENGHVEDEGWRVRQDGTTFWAQVTITALYGDDGRPFGFAKITRDLTERKRAEQSAQRLALLEQNERIGREILARTVGSLFGIGLNLQGAIMELDNPRVQRQLEDAINDLDAVITDLRRAVYGPMSGI